MHLTDTHRMQQAALAEVAGKAGLEALANAIEAMTEAQISELTDVRVQRATHLIVTGWPTGAAKAIGIRKRSQNLGLSRGDIHKPGNGPYSLWRQRQCRKAEARRRVMGTDPTAEGRAAIDLGDDDPGVMDHQ